MTYCLFISLCEMIVIEALVKSHDSSRSKWSPLREGKTVHLYGQDLFLEKIVHFYST
jgi:hypothetical protein